MSVEQRLVARLDRRECPHIAVVVQSADELPAVLASFYALGEARNGWLVHGSLPGMVEDDRRRLRDAGLAVAGLEARGQLSMVELDLTMEPDPWVNDWCDVLDHRLTAGFAAVWFARFAVGPSDEEIAAVLPFETAWMSRFRDRQMVTLCPYISGRNPRDVRRDYGEVAAVHDELVRGTRRRRSRPSEDRRDVSGDACIGPATSGAIRRGAGDASIAMRTQGPTASRRRAAPGR